MSGTVSTPIPTNWRIPLFYPQFSPTNANPGNAIQRSLIIGQCAPGITAPATPVPIYSAQQAAGLYGAQSYIARAVADYFANDPAGTLLVLPLPSATGATAATVAITVAGSPTANGIISLYVAGDAIVVPVTVAQTTTQVATAISGAVNALAGCAMSAVASGGNLVTLTAEIPGALANQTDVRLNYYGLANGEVTPPGLTLTIAAPSGGAGDPDLTGVDAILQDANYDFIVQPYTLAAQTTAMSALLNNVAGRWSTIRQVYGHAFSARCDSDANLLALGASLDDPHLTIMGVVGSPTPPWRIAAMYAGASAASLKNLASQPLQPPLQMVGMLAPWPAARLPKNAVNALLNGGIAQPSYDAAGDCFVLRAVTTYTTNAYGLPDQSYLDSETLFIGMAVTRALASMTTSKYPRAILVDNSTHVGPLPGGVPVVSPNTYLADVYTLYDLLEVEGLVDDANLMKAGTTVTMSATVPGRLDVYWTPNFVSGLRIVNAVNAFTLLAAA